MGGKHKLEWQCIAFVSRETYPISHFGLREVVYVASHENWTISTKAKY